MERDILSFQKFHCQLRQMLGYAIFVLCAYVCLAPVKVTTGLQDAGFQNGKGYRISMTRESAFYGLYEYFQNIIWERGKSETWLHGQTQIWHAQLWNGWIHLIKPNGFFAKYEHDKFFDNGHPFDNDQIVVIFAFYIPVVEASKILIADVVRTLKQNFGVFSSTYAICGYMVNQEK